MGDALGLAGIFTSSTTLQNTLQNTAASQSTTSTTALTRIVSVVEQETTAYVMVGPSSVVTSTKLLMNSATTLTSTSGHVLAPVIAADAAVSLTFIVHGNL